MLLTMHELGKPGSIGRFFLGERQRPVKPLWQIFLLSTQKVLNEDSAFPHAHGRTSLQQGVPATAL